MALHHMLYIATDETVGEVVGKFLEEFPLPWTKEEKEEELVVYSNAFDFIAEKRINTLFRYGIGFKVKLHFMGVAWHEGLDGYLVLLSSVNNYLKNTYNDLILVSEDGSVLLIRKSGDVIVNNNMVDWEPEELT